MSVGTGTREARVKGMRHFSTGVFWILATCMLVACGQNENSSGQRVFGSQLNPNGAENSRVGISYNKTLISEVDGERIAFTLHEPDKIEKGQSYPLVLTSHGYGGRRQIDRPTEGFMARLLASGYGVLSLDERGHGALTDGSGGLIRVLDPDFEGKDWLQVLDWSEESLDWLEFRDSNPVVGAYGGSYGGGFQNLIYRIDPKKRLDAIVPTITWHDLRYSLLPGGVFKTFWASLIGAVGNTPGNVVDPLVNNAVIQGASLNSFSAEATTLFYNNSMASTCEGARPQDPAMTPIAALYIQSVIDQLFNFNEAYKNFECVRKLGGDVRLFMQPNGHVGGPHSRCGAIEMDDATLAFFDEHLKNIQGAADFVPRICYQLDSVEAMSEDAVSVDRVMVGGVTFPEVKLSSLVLSTLSNTVNNIPLMTFPAEENSGQVRSILAGIPTIHLKVSNPSSNPVSQVIEPVVFIGLSKSTDGGKSWALLHDQMMPFRGYGEFRTELVGVLQRFAPGDQLALSVFNGRVDQYGSSGSRPITLADVAAQVSLPLLLPTDVMLAQ